mmetsp:Transcript_26069/g.61801  ORF Transcript_26069/g.61801 Transcript_26069/m.61801 type:complete len:430 (+) Transcript_26069:158-1447(+)
MKKGKCPSLRLPTPPPAETLLDVAQGLRTDAASAVDSTLLGEAVSRAERIMDARPTSEVTVVSWNVWFAETAFDDRLVGLVDELLSIAPDVIGLQEVTQRFATAIRGSAVLAALYDISANDVGAYGCLMLAAADLSPSFREVALPSNMGRSLLLCECPASWSASAASDTAHNTQRPPFTIGTVHLESLNHEVLRRQQLELCAAELRACRGGACLCGDFNFDATRTWGEWRRPAANLAGPAVALERLAATGDARAVRLENENLQSVLPEFVDCWPAVHGTATAAAASAAASAPPPGAAIAHVPSEDDVMGFTFDGMTNPGCCADPQERMRYDRIMCRVRAAGADAGAAGGVRRMLAIAKSVVPSWAGSKPSGSGDSVLDCAMKPVGITLLGRRCIPTPLAGAYYAGVLVKASDHYGLCARLQFDAVSSLA